MTYKREEVWWCPVDACADRPTQIARANQVWCPEGHLCLVIGYIEGKKVIDVEIKEPKRVR